MRPLVTLSKPQLAVFNSPELGFGFAFDPIRLELIETPLELNSLVQEELADWQNGQNTSTFSNQNLRALTLNVTQICNLKCLYCAAGGDGTYGQPQKRADIQKVTPQLLRLLDLLTAGQNFRLTFSGGEPLLYPEGIELVASFLTQESQLKNIKVQFSIVTNGTLLTSQNLELLAKYKMDVTISLDGSPELNRQQRPLKGGGDPTNQLEKGLENLKSYKGQLGSVIVSAVFNKNNFDVLKAYDYFKAWDFDYLDLNFDYFETNSQISNAFVDSVSALAQRLYKEEGETGLKKILFFKRAIEHLDSQIKLSHHCGAGQGYLAMDAKGDLYSCPWRVGQDAYKVNEPSAESLYKATQAPSCGECWARPLCGGGCQFQHESVAPNQIELFCQRMKSLLGIVFMFYVKERRYEQ